MKTTNINKTIIALVAMLAMSAAAQEKKPLTAEEAIITSVTATVQAIDLEKREITLKGPLGNTVTLVVDKRVKRLNEVKVGDEVTANYYASVAGELRAPTKEEQESPVQIVEGTARAPEGTEPAGGVLHVMKVVTVVQGLDLPTRSLTLQGQGPLGYSVTIRARDLEKLKQLRLGDTIVVTYTEALAVSLEKTKEKK